MKQTIFIIVAVLALVLMVVSLNGCGAPQQAGGGAPVTPSQGTTNITPTTLPAGSVSANNFCGSNAASQNFIEFIKSSAESAGFPLERNVGAVYHIDDQSHGEYTCSYVLRANKTRCTDIYLYFWMQGKDGDSNSFCGQNATSIPDMQHACFKTIGSPATGLQYSISFEKKNMEANFFCYQTVGGEPADKLMAFVKAIYDKI